MKKTLLYLCISFFIVSCSSNVDLAIDNPTDFPVEIKVDTLLVEIPAKQVVWVEMGKGEHQITLANDSVIKYNFTERIYMVNPTMTKYLLSEEYYGSEMYQNTYSSIIPNKKITYLGAEFEGNYDVISDVITKVNWDYGPRESLPEMVQVDEDEQYTLLLKLTDPYELIAQYQGQGEETESVE